MTHSGSIARAMGVTKMVDQPSVLLLLFREIMIRVRELLAKRDKLIPSVFFLLDWRCNKLVLLRKRQQQQLIIIHDSRHLRRAKRKTRDRLICRKMTDRWDFEACDMPQGLLLGAFSWLL